VTVLNQLFTTFPDVFLKFFICGSYFFAKFCVLFTHNSSYCCSAS